MKFRLTRDVSKEECPWLDRDFSKGEEVFEFAGHTYGCISDDGIACSLHSRLTIPFFELPLNAVEQIAENNQLPSNP